MGNKGIKDSYTFIKLKGTENYKKWAKKIGFALEDVGLERYANGIYKISELYTKIEKNLAILAISLSEKKIEKQKAEVKKWVFNNSRIYSKAGKICSKSVQ